MSNIQKIRKELLLGIAMLEAARKQKPSKADRLMRMDGGIALAEMHIEKAKELLKVEMDKHQSKESGIGYSHNEGQDISDMH